ncbi:hypothetical protein ABZ749_01065 [Micromonospora sp. NPDC047753]|uniref:hypothetical protein n=1 Tax=Micromonospora sp. NPDC047753 TaxID=3154817 RepID=UPI0033F28819
MRITCGHCGVEFTAAATGRTPRYCSGRCRVAAHRARPRIPTELTSRDRWVRHYRKRPIDVHGKAASSTNPVTWCSYVAAKRGTAGHGLGFVLGDGIACLDLDHCLVDGQPDDRARDVLARVPGAYVEVSPSGDGLHVWGLAPEQPGRRRAGIESYSVGRYITVTGDVFQAGRLVDLSEFF